MCLAGRSWPLFLESLATRSLALSVTGASILAAVVWMEETRDRTSKRSNAARGVVQHLLSGWAGEVSHCHRGNDDSSLNYARILQAVAVWVASGRRVVVDVAVEVEALRIPKHGVRHRRGLAAQSGVTNLPRLLP